MRFWRPASLTFDDLKRNRKCFMKTHFVWWASGNLLLPLLKILECIFIQKCNEEREILVWQCNFSKSLNFVNLDTQSPEHMSNSCLILLVKAREHFKSVIPKKWCRNLIFWRVFFFFHNNVLSLQNFQKKNLENGNEWISKMRTNFAFSRTSHFAESNSSAGDVFGFLIYAFSMQIHSFPF